MNDIATRDTTSLDASPESVMGSQNAGTVQLAQWAEELSAAHKLGTALCGTEFVPADFKGKPEAAAAAILAGKSLGLDPMNSLSNIFVVHGRPALYARTMHALVIAQGHEVVRTEATEAQVTVQARRKGTTQWQEFTWTIERAKKAGYTSNKKYNTDPVAMLTAKAIAEACRTIAPDVLSGVPHSVEEVELEDMGEAPRPNRQGTPKPIATNAKTETTEAISEHDWGELIEMGAQVGLEQSDIASIAQGITGLRLTGPQDIPACALDSIKGAINDHQNTQEG